MKTGRAFKSRTSQTALMFRAACVATALVLSPHCSFGQAKPDLLTPDERAWLVAHGPLRYSTHPAAPPFGFATPDGEFDGITPELMALMARNLAVTIKPVVYASWSDTLVGIRRGEFDLLAGTVHTPEREEYLQFGRPYQSVPTVLFVNRTAPSFKSIKDLSGKRVGAVRNTVAHTWLQREHPEIPVEVVETAREGLLLLAVGRLDAMAAGLPLGHYVIAETSLNNLRVLPDPLFTASHHLAVSKGNSRLHSILEKGLGSIKQQELQDIFTKWIRPELAVPFWRPPSWVWETGLALLASVVVVIAWNQSLRRRVARQSQLIREKVKEEADLERRCTDLIENATEMVFTRDFEGNYISFNPAGERILGYTREELQRMNISQVVVPEHMERTRQQIAALATRESSTYEVQLRTKDGRRVWMEVSMRVLRKEGQPDRLQGIARDITERKQAEQKLRDSELLHQSLVEQLPQSIFRLDRSGRITFTNSRYCQMMGRKQEDLVGKTDFDLFPAELAEKYWADDRRVMEAGVVFETVDHIRTPDGREMFVHVLKSPLRDASGQIAGIQCLFWDVTEHEQAQKALRRSEANLAAAQRLAHVGSWEAELRSLEDFSQNTLWWSDETFRIFGYEPGAVKVTHALFGNAVAPEDRARVWAEIQATLRERKPYDVEHRIVRPDGSARIVRETAEVIYDQATDRPVRFRGTVQDITERRLAENDLKRSHSLLHAVIESTLDGILVVGLDGKAKSYNRRFLKLWRIPENIAAKGDDEELLQFVLGQLKDPAAFLAKVEELYRSTEASSIDEIEFRDGRVFERYSQPQRLGDTIMGRVWSFRDITERKLAEEGLRQSEETFSAIFQSSPAAMSLSAVRDNKIARVNAQFVALTGYRENEVIGKTSLELGIWADPEKRNRFWALTQQAGRVVNVESDLQTKSGEIRHGLSSGEIITIRGEKYLLGSFHDITDRKHAEDALRASQQQLSLHVEQTPLGVIEWNLDFRVTAWNAAAEKIFGFSAAEAMGRRGDELIVPPLVRPQVQPIWEALLAQRGGTRSTNENTTKDGRLILCEWYNTPLVDASGRAIAVASLVQDVTDQRRIEQALRESEERYRLVAEHSDDFVSLHDNQGNRLYISPSYYRVTGWTPNEILNTDYRIRMHPEDLAKVEQAWAANMRGEADTIEHRIRCKDGSWIWVESRRKPILGPDHKVQQIVLWARDITERKQAEEARAQLEAQLRQSQKMEAIGQLAGGVAHDFNNILTVILGNAHLLEEEAGLPSAARDQARQLIKSAERAATLTKQLLAFSRRQVMQMRRLDLNEVLSNVTQMLGHLIGEHILLQCNYGPALPRIEADTGMMEQIIVNLAVNARDAMPNGGRLIISTQLETVSAEQARQKHDARAGQFVTLTVTDTGCGMDASTLSHLFEPFFTTKEVGKGTGLGLAMTYGIIKQHNGWIEAASQVNQGTTFKIFLPACPAVEPAASTSQTSPASDSQRGSETILVVEDEEPVRLFIKGCLETHGYRVLVAENADDAIRVWESAAGGIDLLLTDIVMPGNMSGRELADKLRAAQPGLKIILSSGYSREISAEPGDLPVWICLPKPYDPATLAQTVRRYLDAR